MFLFVQLHIEWIGFSGFVGDGNIILAESDFCFGSSIHSHLGCDLIVQTIIHLAIIPVWD